MSHNISEGKPRNEETRQLGSFPKNSGMQSVGDGQKPEALARPMAESLNRVIPAMGGGSYVTPFPSGKAAVERLGENGGRSSGSSSFLTRMFFLFIDFF